MGITMKNAFAALAVLAALLLTGCGAAVEAATATTPTAQCQEDEACWPANECLTVGNKICGGTAEEAAEAWSRIDTSKIPDTKLKEFKVTYAGRALEGIDFPPSDYYTVKSSKGGYVHVFNVARSPW
jgi:hypothetical protein